MHFSDGIEFSDLFVKDELSSASRARAFLWLCYNYLEAPVDMDNEYDEEQPINPFGDTFRNNKPIFVFISPSEVLGENVDTEEEKILAEKLILQRDNALTSHEAKREAKEAKAQAKVGVSLPGIDDSPVSSVCVPSTKGKKSRKLEMMGPTIRMSSSHGKHELDCSFYGPISDNIHADHGMLNHIHTPEVI
jgi:Ino eighty subunit 1